MILKGCAIMMKKHTKRLIIGILVIIVLVLLLLLGAKRYQNGLNKTNIELYVGDHYKLALKKQVKEVTWHSQNSEIARVDQQGEIEAKKSGKTVVSAKTSKQTYRCDIRVKERPKLSESSMTLKAGQTKKLKLLNTDEEPQWSIEDHKIAQVSDNGTVKALEVGHTYIVASLNDETYKCFINVLDAKTTISVGHWDRDYYLGEKDLHFDKCYLILTDSNKRITTIPITKSMCSGYDLNKVGEQQVTIAYLEEKLIQPIRVSSFDLKISSSKEIDMINGETRDIVLSLPSNVTHQEVSLQAKSSNGSIISCSTNNKTLTIQAHKQGEAYIDIVHVQTNKRYRINVYVSPALYKLTNADDSIGIPVNHSIELEIQAFRPYQLEYDKNMFDVTMYDQKLIVKGIKVGSTILKVIDITSQEVLTYQLHIDQEEIYNNQNNLIDHYHQKLSDLNTLKQNNSLLSSYSTQFYSLHDFNTFTYDQEGQHLGGFYLEDMVLRVKSLKVITQKGFYEYVIEIDHDYWNYDMRIAYELKLESVYQSLKLNGLSDEAKVRRIHDYVCKNIIYDYKTYSRNIQGKPIDYSVDNYSSYDVLFDKPDPSTGARLAVCTSYTGLFLRLAKKANLEVKTVLGRPSNSLNTSHVWNVVKVNGQWYQIDCTWDGSTENTTYEYYLKGRNFRDHILDREFQSLPISQNDYS